MCCTTHVRCDARASCSAQNADANALLIAMQRQWHEEREQVIQDRIDAVTKDFKEQFKAYKRELRVELQDEFDTEKEQAVTLAQVEWDRERLHLLDQYVMVAGKVKGWDPVWRRSMA